MRTGSGLPKSPSTPWNPQVRKNLDGPFVFFVSATCQRLHYGTVEEQSTKTVGHSSALCETQMGYSAYQSPVVSIALGSWSWTLSLAASCLRHAA
jgi:hypothetical protein